MKRIIINILLFLLHYHLCFSQNIDLKDDFYLYKEVKHYLNNPYSIDEIIYEYSNGKITKKSNYKNTNLTTYIEFNYDEYKNKQVLYNSQHEVIKTTILIYDAQQRLLRKEEYNDNNELKIISSYDTLSRILEEKHIQNTADEYNEYSCYYYQFEYIEKNLTKKIFYIDCTLRSSEYYFYDEHSRLIKTKFYSRGSLKKHIIYKYENNQLARELTYIKSSKNNPILDKEYRYNQNNQLIQIIENGILKKVNHYKNDKLNKSENFYPKNKGRPPYQYDNIIEYKYRKKIKTIAIRIA